jgi:hypothetical protein
MIQTKIADNSEISTPLWAVGDIDALMWSTQYLQARAVGMQTVAGAVWLPSLISLLLTRGPIHQEQEDKEEDAC